MAKATVGDIHVEPDAFLVKLVTSLGEIPGLVKAFSFASRGSFRGFGLKRTKP